jgi:hypothetical protein
MPKENKQTETLEPENKVPPMQHWHLMDTFGNHINTEFQVLRIDGGIFTGYKLSNDGINYYATILIPFDKLVSAKLISIEEPDEEEIIEPVKKPKRQYRKRKEEAQTDPKPVVEEDNATHVDPADDPSSEGHEEEQQANDPMKPENDWPAETVNEASLEPEGEPELEIQGYPPVEAAPTEETETEQVVDTTTTEKVAPDAIEGEGRVQES